MKQLQNQVDDLKHKNRELKQNRPNKKRRKKKKKKSVDGNMSKLVDIMKDMNEQITKLADAVTEAVHSGDEDKHTSSEEEQGQSSENVEDKKDNDDEEEEEEEEKKEDIDDNDTESVLSDLSTNSLHLNMRRAPNPKTYLRKDLREYLLAKVLDLED